MTILFLQANFHANHIHFYIKILHEDIGLKQKYQHRLIIFWKYLVICCREKNKDRVLTLECVPRSHLFTRVTSVWLFSFLKSCLTWKGNMQSIFIASFQIDWNDYGLTLSFSSHIISHCTLECNQPWFPKSFTHTWTLSGFQLLFTPDTHYVICRRAGSRQLLDTHETGNSVLLQLVIVVKLHLFSNPLPSRSWYS